MEEVYTQLGALLGMAVDGTDAVGQWLPTAISQYATMKVVSSIPWLVLLTLLLAACVATIAFTFWDMRRGRKAFVEKMKSDPYRYYRSEYDASEHLMILAVMGVAFALLAFAEVCTVGGVLKWLVTPDAALLSELLSRLGGK